MTYTPDPRVLVVAQTLAEHNQTGVPTDPGDWQWEALQIIAALDRQRADQ